MVHILHRHRNEATHVADEQAGVHERTVAHERTPTDERDIVHARRAHEAEARDRFGGVNIGAAFAGWLVAIALTVLLSSIVGAVASAVGATTDFTQDQAEREAGTIGIAAAIALIVVMSLAYFFGGYVAGRMSRFDGAKQGLAVWLIGLLVTLVAVVLGVAFGNEYNVLDRVDMPRIPVPTDAATWGGVITGVVLLVCTLLAALVGGKAGHRYHNRVDRAAFG
jgi:hypothetical protein